MNTWPALLLLTCVSMAGCHHEGDPMPGTWTNVAAGTLLKRTTSTLVFKPDHTFELKITGGMSETMEGTYTFDEKLSMTATKVNGLPTQSGGSPQVVELSADHKSLAFGSLASGSVFHKK